MTAQLGSENFHQVFKDTRIVLGVGLKEFFQYELRVANRFQG
ncbi:hypothetical protein QCM80_29855 [Bradyrhizobium sp. SSUT112]|nr:hypothetical protein [Bradyrhizobium sp. SSUT112]MDH2354840.1 hypothetical protein [Bradyrhizobium sp. SSUT112]